MPTERPRRCSPRRYRANPDPKILHVGVWLRRFASSYKLESQNRRKILKRVPEEWAERTNST